MSYMTVKFLDKEYSIPEDVLAYIELLEFTDSVQKQLANAFVRKLRNEIQKGNLGLLGDEDLATEIEQQVGKFIAKLCDNGIFTRTISDYLKDNKGYQLYSEVNNAALEKMKSLLIQEMDAWQSGYENAINKAESHVTGMGFSIWSSSFVNHAIYAAMEASTLNKQGKEAEAQYQKDMNDLRSRLDSQYGGEKSRYINNTYIPNMEAALTVFAYELLDKYIADLIANGKFDSKTLAYVDISRSNDLLKNLTLSHNKTAILESAFAACPYNTAVYMQAMKYELLDYETFQTAKIFKQSHTILSFLKESWGEIAYPSKFRVNYYCINILAQFTDRTPEEILRGFAEPYVKGILEAYSRNADMISDSALCYKVLESIPEDTILAGTAISKSKVADYVNSTVSMDVYTQLVEKCGHFDLLARIKKCLPTEAAYASKEDIDEWCEENLFASFEEARQALADEIREQRRKEAETAREKAKHEREKRRKRNRIIKMTAIVCSSVAVVICIFFLIKMAIHNYQENVVVPANKYNHAIYLMESGEYELAQDVLISLNGYEDSLDLIEECQNSILELEYDSAVQLMANESFVDAIAILSSLDGYKDSADLIEECEIGLLDIAYEQALQLMNDGEFEDAIAAFEALDEYQDSAEKVTECNEIINANKYDDAVSLANEGSYKDAISILEDLGSYKDAPELIEKYSFLGCEKGDEIVLGAYEQDNDLDNGPEEIEWIVLERSGNQALVISKYCLEQMPFNETLAAVTWENSTIRDWLNNDFWNAAFSEDEQSIIRSSTIPNPDDADHERSGYDTVDKVYLLSENEAIEYFDSDSDRCADAAEFVSTTHCYWILRTTGSASNVAHVDYNGEVGYYENVDRNWWIRPAMWIEIGN